MVPTLTREEQLVFQGLQKALAEEKALIRIDYKRLNRKNSPFFNAWENVIPLVIILLVSLGLMITDNMVVGMAMMVFLVFMYVIFMPFILKPVMYGRVVRRIVPRIERFIIAWRYGGITLVLAADEQLICKSPFGDWCAFTKDYFPDLIPVDARDTDMNEKPSGTLS